MKNKIILILFILFFCISIFLFTKIKYQEDVLVMVPSSLSTQVELLQQTPFSNKLFVIIKAKDSNDLNTSVDIVKNKLNTFNEISESVNIDRNFLLSYYYNIPYLWTQQLENKVNNLITQEKLQETNENNVILLFSPEGNFFKDFISIDPIGIMPILLENLKKLNFTENNLKFINGYFTNDENNIALLLYDTNKNNFDRLQADKIVNYINDINNFLPKECKVFSLGTSRYTQENNNIIVKDIKVILVVSILLIFGIFFLLFKDKTAIFIYVVPVFVLIPSAVFTYFKFGFLSGITLGFGSVLMGLAVDYSIYVYYSFKSSKDNVKKSDIIKSISKPIILSAITSIVSFLVLYFCDIVLFKQLAYFATFGLIYAILIAIFVSPIFYKSQNKPIKQIKLPKNINYKSSIIFIIIVIVLGIFCIQFIKTDFSFESLNSVSKQCIKDREIFDELIGYGRNKKSLLFVGGSNKEEILSLSNEISTKQHLDILDLILTKQQQEENLKRWNQFWTKNKISKLKTDINLYYESFGIDANNFKSFYELLENSTKPINVKDFDITTIYNPFIKLNNKIFILHFVEQNFELPQEFQNNENIILLSQNDLQKTLSHKTVKTIFVITSFILLLDFILLIFSFKNIKLALISFIPIIVTIKIFIILSVLFSIKINLFSLFCLPLIIGLSIDYAIFIIHQHTLSQTLYPSIAVLSASLSSLAGFGSLIFANHKVLFSMGFTLSIGIIISSLVSIYIMPSIIKKVIKILPIFIIVFFVGCSSMPKIKYENYLQQEQSIESKSYQGEIYGKLFFTSIMNKINEQKYIVITLNEFGIKLCDMAITKEDVCVKYKAKFISKFISNKLAKFYNNFLFNIDELVSNKEENKILYNNKDKTIIFWSQNEFGN